jgi:glycosyltransferase involved in cell wall biosynthesis
MEFSPMKKRVFFTVALPPPVNGQSVSNKKWLEELVASDKFDVIVANISPNNSNRGGIRYHINRILSVIFALGIILIKARKGDVAYFVYESGLGVFYNLLLCGVSRLIGLSVFIHHHTSAHVKQSVFQFRLVNLLAGRLVSHIVLSEEMRNDMLLLYGGGSPIYVCENTWIIPGADYEGSLRNKNKFTIGFLSNLTEEKGLHVVIEAYESLRRSVDSMDLYIAGPVSSHADRQRINDLLKKHSESVKYFGPVFDGRKDDFFDSIDIFVFPSKYKYEAQPLVLIESLAHGVPVITSRQGYSAELVGSAGTVIDPNAPELGDALGNAWQAWRADPACYVVSRKAAYSRFLDLQDRSTRQRLAIMEAMCE